MYWIQNERRRRRRRERRMAEEWDEVIRMNKGDKQAGRRGILLVK